MYWEADLLYKRRAFYCLLMILAFFNSILSAASYKISTQADFAACTISQLEVADEDGNAANYVRLHNTNPGRDSTSGDILAVGTGRIFSKKRRVSLTETRNRNRFLEKIELNIEPISGAKSDWQDLRLVDSSGNKVPFRLLNFEVPIDNRNSQATVLFEADASQSATTDYWLYYGNPNALGEDIENIDRFYLDNHDFENGASSWANCAASTLNTACVIGVTDENSILPAGYVGYESKSCLIAYYPEGANEGTENGKWRGWSQTFTGPTADRYIVTIYKKTFSGAYNKNLRTYIRHIQSGANSQTHIPAGITDWTSQSLEFDTGGVRTAELAFGMYFGQSVDTGWRERGTFIDWVDVKPKYPLQITLGIEEPAGYVTVGSITSQVIDTGITSPQLRNITWVANTGAPGTSVYFQTRTGATVGACTSAPWSAPIDVNGADIPSVSARYLQFRAFLQTNQTAFTPLLDEVEVFFDLPASKLRVDAPSDVTAGEYFDFRVTALDSTNATATTFTGLVNIFSLPAGVTVTPTAAYTFQTDDQGTALFQGRKTDVGVFSIEAQSFGLSDGSSGNINSNPGEATQIAMVAPPLSVTAGNLFDIDIEARDRYGNVDTNNNMTLVTYCSDSYPASISAAIQLVNGATTLANTALFSAPSQLIRVTAPSNGLEVEHNINVSPAAANSLRLTSEPDQYQNVPFDLKVDAIDIYDNIATTYGGAYTLNVSSGTIVPNSGTLVAGTKTQLESLDTEGVLTISATSGGLSGNMGVIVHPQTPASLDSFSVDAGSIQLAGVPFTLTIEAKDEFLNTVTAYKGACRLTTNVGSIYPGYTNGYDFLDGFMALPITLTGASDTVVITVYDLKDNTKLGMTYLTVNSSTLDHFDVVASSPVVAGASCSFLVKPIDAAGNLLTKYTGTISISNTSTGGDVLCPTVYTFKASDKGIKSFVASAAAIFTKAESVRIQVDDSGRRGISNFIEVMAASDTPTISIRPDKFTIELGEALSYNISLTDPYLNPLEGFTGNVNITYSDPSVAGPANYNFQSFEDGFHRFLSQVRSPQIGSFTIQIEEPVSGVTAVSPVINVVSGQTAAFSVSPSSVTISAGDTFLFDVTASDTAGNINVLYNGSVRFSTLDTQAVLPDDSTLVQGQGAFNATFKTAGVYELACRDTKEPSIVGTMSVTVLASAPSKLEFEIQDADMMIDAGIAFPYRVHIKDAFDNHASYTGNIAVSSQDTHASADHFQNFAVTNQSIITDNWTLITAGVQELTATGAVFVDTLSKRVEILAGAPDHITGDFPLSVYSEFYYPFKVRIEDIYGNPTPRYTDTINPTSGGPGYQESPANHTFSAGDNGEYTFNLHWDRGSSNPTNTTVTFNDSGGLPSLTINVFIDCPRSNNGAGTLSSFWLSEPDRQVVASQAFGMTLRGSTGRDRLATITATIEFEVSNGDFWVNQGSGWKKTLTMTNQSQINFQAMVTRTGYLSVIAKSQAEPLKTGTVSFVSRPNVLDSLTISANSPQNAGVKFPYVTEWWDVCKNYAETTGDTITMSALAGSGYSLDPDTMLPGGRAGKFDASVTSGSWVERKFWNFESESNIHHDKLLNKISIRGLYNEDFTDGALDNPGWKVMEQERNSWDVTGFHNLNNGVLYIETTGNGNLFDDTSSGDFYESDIDDGYYYVYQDWPATDTYNFEARLYVLRYWYDKRKRTNQSMVGLLMRDDSHADEPRYVCTQMQNTTVSSDFNMNTWTQVTFRRDPNGGVYRRKASNSNGNSGTQPKWLRLRRVANDSYEGAQSNDTQTWYPCIYRNNTAVTPNFGAGQKIGVAVCADSTTYPGIGWFTKFTVNRYYDQGIYTSPVYDTATSAVTYDQISLVTNKPAGTRVDVAVRASNNPAALGSWTNLGNINNASLNIGSLNGRRYFQYRLTLVANTLAAGVYDQTPEVEEVEVTYNIDPVGDTFEGREIVTLLASTTNAAITPGSATVEIKGGLEIDLIVTAPASCTAGEPFSITVTAVDKYGNVADDASGTWIFSTSDLAPYAGQVPPNYTLVPVADKGEHTFHKMSILYNGPTATISVTDGTITATSAPIIVNPGELKDFVVFGNSPQVASTSFEIGITARDLFDNVKSDYVGSLTFYDDKTGGTSHYLPATISSADWVNGIATLSPGVSFTKVETVHVSCQGDYRSGKSNDIEITSATSSALLLSVSTTQPEAGLPFSLTNMATDEFGNQSTDYNGEVHFSVTDSHGSVVIPPDYSYLPSDAGMKVWLNAMTLITPGLQTIRVEDTSDSTMFSEVPVTVLPGPVANFVLTCSPVQTANVPFNLQIEAYDAYGNLKTNFSEAVAISSDFDSILPVTAGGFSNGKLLIPSMEVDHSALPFNGKINVTYGTAVGSTTIDVLPSSADFSHFYMEAIPASPTAGDAFKLTIKAVGANGAVYTGYSGLGANLTASSTSGIEVVPAMDPSEAINFDIGVKEVYARIWEAGEITIWAHDKTLNKVGSLTINVLPTNLSYFTITPGTSTASLYPNVYYQEANAAFPMYFGAYDSIDNLKTDYNGTVNLTHNGTGTLTVASITFVDGLGTIPAQIYDNWGKIRIQVYDPLLDKQGLSNYIQFFGPLSHFAPLYGVDQSDETPFLVTLEAFDIYGQKKLNFFDAVDLNNLDISPASAKPVSASPLIPAFSWKDGIAYDSFIVNRKDGGPNEATATFTLNSVVIPAASATITVAMRKQGGAAVKFLIETYSPQLAEEGFPLLVKAVDASNQIDPNWTGTINLFATDTFGVGRPIIPNPVVINAADNGVFSTTVAQIDYPATYTISAVSGALTGSFYPLLIKQGKVAGLKVDMPQFAPLSQNFEMTISAVDKNGSIKGDYAPDGPILLKLNATATGLIGVQFVDPSLFSNGIATITNQTYSKSQRIFIYAREPYLNEDFIGGPTDVFGIPTKLILQPLDNNIPPSVDMSRNFFWRQLFQVRATVKDSNGFTVANFDDDVYFKILPGTAPTATDPALFAGYEVQHFNSSSQGVQDFTFKVDYSTTVSPINLNFVGSFTHGMVDISKTLVDLPFYNDHVFDRYEFVNPVNNGNYVKGATFSVTIRALDNYDMPFVIGNPVASMPTFNWAHVSPAIALTNLKVTPANGSAITFANTDSVTLDGFIDYDEDEITSFTYSITPEGGVVGSDSVKIGVVLGEPRISSKLWDIASNTTYVLSMYIKTDGTLSDPDIGTAAIQLALYKNATDEKWNDPVHLMADLHDPSGGSSTIVYSSGTHGWKRYYWWFTTDALTKKFSIWLGANSGEVYIDGIQLEKAVDPANPSPSNYSPHPISIIHPSKDKKESLTGDQYWKK